MYRTLINPVLLYGSESWVVLEKDACLLRIFERQVLQTIFGAIKENGVFRRLYNHELEAIYGKPGIISDIKRNRLRWLGHMVRMKEGRVTQSFYMIKLYTKEYLLVPKVRGDRDLRGNVKMGLNRLNVVNWMPQARGKTKSFQFLLGQVFFFKIKKK